MRYKPPGEVCHKADLTLAYMDNHEANTLVTLHHYLRRPIYIGRNISYQVCHADHDGVGVLMYGYPVFHTKYGLVGEQQPLRNGELVELCRVWMPDDFPTNSESCAMGRSITMLRRDWPQLHNDGTRNWLPEPRAIITFADAEHYHQGTIYKAANYIYLGWVKGRKATPGHGQGRWANAQRDGSGQTAGIRKSVYLYIIDRGLDIDIEALRKTYKQEAP